MTESEVYEMHNKILKIKDYLNVIDRCTQQQRIIVNDVLDLSKLENNKVEFNPVIFNPKELVEAVVQMFQAQVEQKTLKLVLSLTEANDWVKADNYHLSQVIVNLLSNSIKFTHAGEVVVDCKLEGNGPDEQKLTVKVKDTGIGMNAEESSKLFGKYSQASRHTTSEFGGSGLGLSISKKLVEGLGGSITVESQKNKGSTFSFWIKCQSLTEEERYKLSSNPSAPSPTLTPTLTSSIISATTSSILSTEECSKRHILIVEDNLINQKILANFLENKSCTYKVAKNGMEAVEKYLESKFDIILMDIEMPVMNGLEATLKIRELEKERETGNRVPIIGLSGNARKKQVEEALASGMDDYLTKPYQSHELLNMIKKHITTDATTSSSSSSSSSSLSLSSSSSSSTSSLSVFPISPTACSYSTVFNQITPSTTIFENGKKRSEREDDAIDGFQPTKKGRQKSRTNKEVE
eukprot:TRINITY_DN796_c0_g5_i1.p1 TRINITY_DN796_c0_g5~~TRINITY_DN796_c0_g5_i1.p1  ORF type:complete len:465 (-),score=179.46 TRINITY_DN796_c0_g5_i1:140-1534(-)